MAAKQTVVMRRVGIVLLAFVLADQDHAAGMVPSDVDLVLPRERHSRSRASPSSSKPLARRGRDGLFIGVLIVQPPFPIYTMDQQRVLHPGMETQVWTVGRGWLTATAGGLSLAFGGLEQPRFEPLAGGAGFNTRRPRKAERTCLRAVLRQRSNKNTVRTTVRRLSDAHFALPQAR